MSETTFSGLVLKSLWTICCFNSFVYFPYVVCLVFWFLTFANWFANWVSSSDEPSAGPSSSSLSELEVSSFLGGAGGGAYFAFY